TSPPPRSFSPETAFTRTDRSTSAYFVPSATHKLNRALGPSLDVCARARPASYATTFQTLPCPSPVFAALHPAGNFPSASFSKVQVDCAARIVDQTTATIGRATRI